ncbi:MAG: cephalosporin hydroxylase [Hyphomicrobium sp. 32-62-53]|nr:MAG: cephalosporin hydroxylase [Hyphomicrobium sp. 12-62-95]OYX97112.1 MAG: cephalosporin hydroxylase [Hyphomicrobium sp. 32-62-53]
MSFPDDRGAFEAEKRENCLALGADAAMFRASIDAILASDKYKYSYLWSFLGVPIIQLPADVMALQEVVWQTKPDVIIETGIARGGSLIFFSAMQRLIGKGKTVGVDVDIRPHNRDSIEKHPMADRISLIEGSSVAPEIVEQVKEQIPAGSTTMVVLDSDHSYDHVLAELNAYAPLVSPGQYLIVADTLLGYLRNTETPITRSKVWLPGDEPLAAVRKFLETNTNFEQDEVANGKLILSASPGGFLRRRTNIA